ncbi:MAG: hypothetical protein HQ508_00735 [Candidatus Marinimicrobia bacterium]|nr:hypothetical protein [Candidatus Neomarinimicrobiota bacterium]
MGLLSAFRYNRKGKRIGNEIADSMMISRNLFHSSVVKGGQPYHLPVLASMHDEGHSLNVIKKNMIPYLAAGLDVLERENGHQPSIDKAREVVNALLEDDDDIRAMADGMRAMTSDDPVSAMKEFESQIAELDNEEEELDEDVADPPVSDSNRIEVTSNNWERDDGDIKRVIQYEGAQGEGITSQLHISYLIEPGMVMPHRHLFFMNGPSLGFDEGYLTARIWSPDGSSEDDTGFFVVHASETQDGLATLFGPEPGDDPDKMREVLVVCASLFSSGEDLLISLNAQEEVIMRLPIPGGDGFAALVEEALDAAKTQSGNIFDKF